MHSDFYHWVNSAESTRVICSNQMLVKINFLDNNAEETVSRSLHNIDSKLTLTEAGRMANTGKISDFWGNCWNMCGIIPHILFLPQLWVIKHLKQRYPEWHKYTASALFWRKFILYSWAWKVPFSHSTAQQEQKLNYVRYHFTELSYKWQFPGLPGNTQHKCYLGVHRITETELWGIHSWSNLFFMKKKPTLEQSLKKCRPLVGHTMERSVQESMEGWDAVVRIP